METVNKWLDGWRFGTVCSLMVAACIADDLIHEPTWLTALKAAGLMLVIVLTFKMWYEDPR